MQREKKRIFLRNTSHLHTLSHHQVGLVNLHRIMVFWPTVTAHLIEVANHDHVSLREKGVDALTQLVHAALAFPRDPPIQDSPGLQQVRNDHT